MSGLKLLAGRLADAWLEYPETRRKLGNLPPGPPIFLTGTHRSGTTWLARMLAVSGVWYSHEPFSPKKGRRTRSFEYRRPDERDAQIDALFRDVLAGRFRRALSIGNADHPLMPLRIFPSPTRRVLVKDPLACLLTEYLTRNFGLRTLILFRHPAGFAASIKRLGWPRAAFLRHFLADGPLMHDFLEPYRSIITEHAHEDSLRSAAVLHGALNTVLWRCVESGQGRPLIFEELSSNPLDSCRNLFADLGLPYDSGVRAEHERLCFAPDLAPEQYRPHAVERSSAAMPDSWKRQLSQAERDEVREIWHRFDVPLYRAEDDWH
jgi:hypothetical protein